MSEPRTNAGLFLVARETLNSRSFAIVTPELVAVIEAEAVAAERARIRAAVEALPIHSIDGYEWECNNCQYRWVDGDPPWVGEGYYDRDGRLCDHMTLLDRAAVLALIGEVDPETEAGG